MYRPPAPALRSVLRESDMVFDVDDPAHLIEALRRSGMRVTAPRRAVCEILAANPNGHLTVPEITERMEQRSGGRSDQSTVYRTIDALERAGVAHHVHLGHGPSVVHLSDEPAHHHLVCEVCNRTVDLPIEDLDALTDLLQIHGFEPTTLHFALVGRCRDHLS